MTVFNMRVDAELLALVDELRRVEPDIPNRSEMARRAIEFMASQKLGKEKRKKS